MKLLMCSPEQFRVDYAINPWMNVGSVNSDLAQKQWHELRDAYVSLGAEVTVIDADESLPDMVFAADQGIFRDKKVVLSRFRYAQRRGESVFYAKWFEDHGYEVLHLPPEIFLEGGGESWWLGDTLLLGRGYRTSEAAAHVVENFLGKRVVSLQLIDERFYHLDTCLFVLNATTVFYYPPALSDDARETLKKMVPNVFELTEKEALSFAANSVVVDKTVVVHKGNESFEKKLHELEMKTISIDVSEFLKSGGGIHCLTAMIL